MCLEWWVIKVEHPGDTQSSGHFSPKGAKGSKAQAELPFTQLPIASAGTVPSLCVTPISPIFFSANSVGKLRSFQSEGLHQADSIFPKAPTSFPQADLAASPCFQRK